MCPPSPVRWRLCVGLALVLGACSLPEAKLANLREVHQPDGKLSYRGNVHNDVSFVIKKWVQTLPVNISGVTDNPDLLGGLSGEPSLIENPGELSLENLIDLAEADSDNLLTAGYQVEAFGWLGPDDQYLLGRERAVIELGKAARRLDVREPLVAAADAAGPDELSSALAALARSVLGDTSFTDMLEQGLSPGAAQPAADAEGAGASQNAAQTAATPSPAPTTATTAAAAQRAATAGGVTQASAQSTPTFAQARADLAALSVDRQGALRVLALCDVLFARQPGRLTAEDEISRGLRALALDAQKSVVAMALATCLEDPAPVVRAAAVRAVAGFNGGPPVGLLKLAATDPAWEVSHAGLTWVADHGLPLERVPADLRDEARDEWLAFLVGQCQSPDTRLSFVACRALVKAVPDGPRGLRPEVWTDWFRAKHPDRPLPEPLVARTPPGVEP